MNKELGPHLLSSSCFYFCPSLRRGGFCCSFSLEIVKEYDVNL
jgi:hypothetical protein